MSNLLDTSKWIWLDQQKEIPNQYIQFRKEFEVRKKSKHSKIYISVDTDFIIFINGKKVGSGQFSDYPDEKTYSSFNITSFLKSGRNVLAVLAYFKGDEFFTYIKGKPGLIASIKIGEDLIISDSSWKCRQCPAYKSGLIEKTSSQIGFAFLFDAREEDCWIEDSYNDVHWHNAKVQRDYNTRLKPRALPVLQIKENIPVKILTQGVVWRQKEKSSFAETFSHDFLCYKPQNEIFKEFQEPYSLQKSILANKQNQSIDFKPLQDEFANGYYLILDLGEESVGLLSLDIIASKGTVCDIAVGEHLDDGRVRVKFGANINFADRYICKEGKNKFSYIFRRIAGRYLQVHFTCIKEKLNISYLGIQPVELNLSDKVSFESNDIFTNRLHEISVNTMKLCMHEHYEDGPWREQSLYAYDARNQALFGYYLFGNYDFAKTSFELLGKGLRPDGFLTLCAPSKLGRAIPIFSFVWISAILEHFMHSGSLILFKQFAGQIKNMIELILQSYDAQTGLYLIHNTDGLWNFYEWTVGLEGNIREKQQAPFNFYFYEMLDSYSKLLKVANKRSEVDEIELLKNNLANAINVNFWNEKRNAYCTVIKSGKQSGFHEHVQALALYNGLVPETKIELFLENIYLSRFESISFSAFHYLLRPMMEINEKSRNFIADLMYNSFESMLFAGATSLWETKDGSDAFGGAGSLCHAWSAINIYYLHAYVLGVRPLEPGFKKILISPYADKLNSANGTIMTPHGIIHVVWHKTDNGLNLFIEGPEEITCELNPYIECPIHKALYNTQDLCSEKNKVNINRRNL